jgi:hypothetical protein
MVRVGVKFDDEDDDDDELPQPDRATTESTAVNAIESFMMNFQVGWIWIRGATGPI